jgi:hypothetical protein
MIEIGALGAALTLTFFAGEWTNSAHPALPTVQSPLPPPIAPLASPAYNPAKAFPRLNEPRPEEPPGPEPRAIAARARVIRRDADAITNECQQAAGGNWDKWQRETAPFRAALKEKVDSLKSLDNARALNSMIMQEPLEGRNKFPLFEISARQQLRHLYDQASLDGFRQDRAVVAASRWLRERGIDLIFVPAPKMTEVYIEHFLDPCPADGIIAPHVRKTLLGLLEQDVEVVDGFSLFRALREPVPDYLYNTADSHWAPRAMRIMAKEVADRIVRYRFGASARFALPIVKSMPGDYQINPGFGIVPGQLPIQNGWGALSNDQKQIAEPVQTRTLNHVLTLDDRVVTDDPHSPVLVIGHSYVPNFREQLVRELNLLVASATSDDQTTESFGDFFRDPRLLAHRRVIVWVTTEYHMTRFFPMPKPVMAALGKN